MLQKFFFGSLLCFRILVKNFRSELVAKGASLLRLLLQNSIHMLGDGCLDFARWLVCVDNAEEIAVVVLVSELFDPPLQAVGGLVERDEAVCEGVDHVVVF